MIDRFWQYGFWALLLVVAGTFVFIVFKATEGKSMDELRLMCYRLILEAEHAYKEGKMGPLKMNYVIDRLYQEMPDFLRTLVSREALGHLCQMWFDEVKDLLDDGKANGSIRDEK
jgi:hypothetical protein